MKRIKRFFAPNLLAAIAFIVPVISLMASQFALQSQAAGSAPEPAATKLEVVNQPTPSTAPTTLTAQAVPSAYAPDPKKVLRYAFEIAETGMDPIRISDVYSNIVLNAVYDTPLSYDYLARPLKVRPNTLAAMPEISTDYRTFTFHVKPGIYFAPHEVFKGKKRELVAEDYVYSIKRVLDPENSATQIGEYEGKIIGAADAINAARKTGKFNYDAQIEGLRVLDRYTFQVKMVKPAPIFIYVFTDCRASCAVAREVVEFYGKDFVSHPLGSGAYQLTSWKRASKMVFEANPNFREEYFDGTPTPGDKEAEAILKALKGRRLPMVNRIEVSIIEEMQPRWISFLGGGQDLLWRLPEEFATVAVPGNKLAPNLVKQQIEFAQVPNLDLNYMFFNMKDPVIGGYTPDKIALRRAISLGYQTDDEIRVIRKYQAVPAHTPYAPGVAGYDPNFKTSANEYSPAKANALLDMYGYKRAADGWRNMPDGKPLILKSNSTPTERDKQIDEVWKRSMDDIGVKIEFNKAKWPDLLKASYAGKLMMWQLGGSASTPDAETWLTSLYGPNSGIKSNFANFQLKEYDEAFEAASLLPDSPERTKLYQKMAKLMVAYAPWKINIHRISTDMWYPYVKGFRRPLVQSQSWWKYVDIDVAMQKEFEAKN